MNEFLIKKIKIKNQEESCEQINLIIGSNNRGKTTLLKEISEFSKSGFILENSKWVREINIEYKGIKKVIKELVPIAIESESFDMVEVLGKTGYSGFNPQGVSNPEFWNKDIFDEIKKVKNQKEGFNITKNYMRNPKWFFHRFLINSLLINEGCEQRLEGPFDTVIKNLKQDSKSNLLSYLFVNSEILKRIQDNVFKIFKFKIGFDDLQQGEKSLRILPDKKIKGSTNSLDVAEKWENKSSKVREQGHGLKAYLRLVFALLQSKKKIILIDEPELFLHPPQRKALGVLIAELAEKEGKQVFIATHDTEFLRGIISSRINKIKIFYLKSQNSEFTYSIFNSKDIKELISKHSQILNERILNSFFYRKTILFEAEDDRLFYEYVASLYYWDLFQDVNFIGFNGKSSVIPILNKLNRLGINASLVFDIDYLYGTEIFPEIGNIALKNNFLSIRNKINNLIRCQGFSKGNFKKGGMKYIKDNYPTLYGETKGLLEELRKNKIYIVEAGQMESWVNVGHDSSEKIQNMLEKVNQKEYRKLKFFVQKMLS